MSGQTMTKGPHQEAIEKLLNARTPALGPLRSISSSIRTNKPEDVAVIASAIIADELAALRQAYVSKHVVEVHCDSCDGASCEPEDYIP